MILYGHTYTNDSTVHNLIDEMITPSSPYVFSIFGESDTLEVVTTSKHEFHGLDVEIIFDKVTITNSNETAKLVSLSNGKYCSINNFESFNASIYAKPSLFEIAKTWFITIEPGDTVSFYYVTYGNEESIEHTPLYTDPVCYDPKSDMDYIIPKGIFDNPIADEYLVVRFFTAVTTSKTLTADELTDKVWFVDGIQTTELDAGLHKVNIFLSPDTNVDLTDFIFVPVNCITEYANTQIVPNLTSGTSLYRLTLPSQYDFTNIYVNDVEVPSVRLGYMVFFKTDLQFTELDINMERATKIMSLTDIYQADYIIDVDFTIPFNYINIHGTSLYVGNGSNTIKSYDFSTKEVVVELDLSNAYGTPLPGEYFTVSAYTESGIMLKDAQFKLTSIDTTNVENTIVRGKKV